MTALTQRLVAHPRWRWHIGMVAESTRVYDVGKCFAGYEIPDIHHPSTKGWLLHMLRESGHGASARRSCLQDDAPCAEMWAVIEVDSRHQVLAREPFEGAALASALLAVWGEP